MQELLQGEKGAGRRLPQHRRGMESGLQVKDWNPYDRV